MLKEKKRLPDSVLQNDPLGVRLDPYDCQDYFKQYKTDEQRSLVLQFTEMIIFHSLILLLNSKQPIDVQDNSIYMEEYRKMIEDDFNGKGNLFKCDINQPKPASSDPKLQPLIKSKLPPFFCLDIYFKYRMYDEACEFLYYRGEHNELLQLIRWEFEQMRDKCDQKKKMLSKMKDDSGAAADESNAAFLEAVEQRDSFKKIRD